MNRNQKGFQRILGYRDEALGNKKELETGYNKLQAFENLRPIGVIVRSTLGLQVRDAGSNPVLVHFHSS